MRHIKIGIATLLVFILSTCGEKASEPPTPFAPILNVPLKDEVCLTGKIISDSESTVEFKWSAAGYAENYELSIKNLLTSAITTHTTSATNIVLTLMRNTPYSWFVTSKSSKSPTTAVSPTWKFYNST